MDEAKAPLTPKAVALIYVTDSCVVGQLRKQSNWLASLSKLTDRSEPELSCWGTRRVNSAGLVTWSNATRGYNLVAKAESLQVVAAGRLVTQGTDSGY
jgi:hypothetical protein